jgi:hypothetical protein
MIAVLKFNRPVYPKVKENKVSATSLNPDAPPAITNLGETKSVPSLIASLDAAINLHTSSEKSWRQLKLEW